jgi:hypothetical protein
VFHLFVGSTKRIYGQVVKFREGFSKFLYGCVSFPVLYTTAENVKEVKLILKAI